MQLGKSYKRLNDHHHLAPHDGIFRRRITLAEAVALIMSGAIGAGVLGIPYAIAQVGVPAGIIAILVVGALTLAHNLTIGDDVDGELESVFPSAGRETEIRERAVREGTGGENPSEGKFR
jgi:amino acid permease